MEEFCEDLYSLATEMMNGDLEAAKRWCENPNKYLGGDYPKYLWQTEDGQKQVLKFIFDLETGCYC